MQCFIQWAIGKKQKTKIQNTRKMCESYYYLTHLQKCIFKIILREIYGIQSKSIPPINNSKIFNRRITQKYPSVPIPCLCSICH